MARRRGPATIRDTSHGGLSSPQACACQVRSRRRRGPERPDFTGAGLGGDNGTWDGSAGCAERPSAPALFDLPRSIRSPTYT